MIFYTLEPEVAGGFGDNTIMDPTLRPPKVTKFHYQFDGWLGDELLETVACFIVTQPLMNRIRKDGLTGVDFADVKVSRSEQFDDLYPGRLLPDFVWLQITGMGGKDDFGLSKDHRLIVSDRALEALRAFRLEHCAVAAYAN